MADIALVFGWTPSTMEALSLEALCRWHQRALDRAPLIARV